MTRTRLAVVLASVVVLTTTTRAQVAGAQSAPTTLTLEEALQYALDHYPTIRAALEQVNVSTANVSVAQSSSLPHLDALWQTNRATANNVFGQLLPQAVIPSAIRAGAIPSASNDSVWGSAVGALASWEPFDFGLRGAPVRGAEAAVVRARADESLTRLEVQSAVGAAFLAVVRADTKPVAATQADVERRDVLARPSYPRR